MKTLFWLVVLSLGIFAGPLQAAKPEYTGETLVAAVSQELDRVTEAVATVKDEASATKASAQLAVIAENLKKIALKSKGLVEPDEKTANALVEKLAAKVQEVERKVQEAQPKIVAAGPKTVAIISQGLSTFGEAMQEVGATFEKMDAAGRGR
jgi:hypothetical protein